MENKRSENPIENKRSANEKYFSNLTWDELVLQMAGAGTISPTVAVPTPSTTNWKAIGLFSGLGIIILIVSIVIYKKVKKANG